MLWFGTNPTLLKVQEIENDPRVTVAIQDRRENASLVLYGTARIERDVALRRRWWLGTWRLLFPNGPAGDPYVVLQFEAERVELLNFRRDVIPEPFGLRPLVLVQREGWALDEPERAQSTHDLLQRPAVSS